MTQDPERSVAQRSRLSSLGLGSFGKATGALGAPVVGLIALAAVAGAGAGVGAGLGSLPGKPPLAGASGHPVEAQLVSAGDSSRHGGALRASAALASLAGPLAGHALAGAGVAPRKALAPAHRSSPVLGSSSKPQASAGTRHLTRSSGPTSHGILQRPSRPLDSGSNPGRGGSGQPSDTQSPGSQPQGSSQAQSSGQPVDQGQQQGQSQPQGQPQGQSSPSQSDGSSGSSSSTSGSGSSGSNSSSSTSSTSGSSTSTTTTTSNGPQASSTSTPRGSNSGSTTTTPSDS